MKRILARFIATTLNFWNRFCLRIAYSSLFPARLKYWIAVHVLHHYTSRGGQAYMPAAIDKSLTFYWNLKNLGLRKKNAKIQNKG